MVIRGVTLIDGRGGPPMGPVDVVVEGNTIARVSSVGYPGLPINEDRRPDAGDHEIDGTGMYLLPGFIDTDMTRSVPDKARQHWIDRVPAARPGTVEDVAAAVAFLASDEAAYITGMVLEVDGGLHVPKTLVGASDAEEQNAGQ